MQNPPLLTFVVAANNKRVLECNLLASGCLRGSERSHIIVQEGYPSASKAYNDAIDRSETDLIAFVHQDVIFPEDWIANLERSLQYLDNADPDWGVIGCWGSNGNQQGVGYLYSTGLGLLGKPFESPQPVETLDEVVLVLRKSSGLRFDEGLPHYHLYGTDISLRAEALGKRNYVVPAFCIHNTSQIFVLPPEFYECYAYVRRAWKHRLPVQTPCIRITRSNLSTHARRLRELYLRYVRREEAGAPRSDNVQSLIHDVSFLRRDQNCGTLSTKV